MQRRTFYNKDNDPPSKGMLAYGQKWRGILWRYQGPCRDSVSIPKLRSRRATLIRRLQSKARSSVCRPETGLKSQRISLQQKSLAKTVLQLFRTRSRFKVRSGGRTFRSSLKTQGYLPSRKPREFFLMIDRDMKLLSAGTTSRRLNRVVARCRLVNQKESCLSQ